MPKDIKGNEGITESILNFVDLAGSEKISIHKTNKSYINNLLTGNNVNVGGIKERQIESKTINKSLFFLTQVISLKSSGKLESHIPYRNSPLTKLLRSSLGGNSRTAIILCLNPCISQLEQTTSTLRFGLNAKKIENQVQNNNILQNMIKEYETRILELEFEKNDNKVNSDNLVKMIQTLIEQKNNLEQRINTKELFNSQQQTQRQIQIRAKKKHISQDFIHIDNVGLIKVNDDYQDYEQDINYHSERYKSSFKQISNTNYQKQATDEQKQSLSNQLIQKEVEQNKIIFKLDQKLAGKKRKLQTMKSNKITLGIENSRLKQELSLYKSQNIPGLKKLSSSQLEKLEQNVEVLLKNIRNQMNINLLKHEFDGDKPIVDRLDKALNLRELKVCELVELTNDFFEPNLKLNTTSCDEDDSAVNTNINEELEFQNHNIHNKANIFNNNSFEKNQKQTQIQTINLNNKFISQSPLDLCSPPRQDIKYYSYKEDFKQNQMENNLHSSLTNFNPLQNILKQENTILNNVNVNNLNHHQGISKSQNFGVYQNYFNEENSCQIKQDVCSSIKQITETNKIDSEAQNQFIIQYNHLANNQAIQESSRPTVSSDCLSSKLIFDIIGEKIKKPFNQTEIINSSTSVFPQNITIGEQKTQSNSIKCNNNEILSIYVNHNGGQQKSDNLLNYESKQNNYQSNQTPSNKNEQHGQQQIIQSLYKDGRSSDLEIIDNSYLNTVMEQISYQPQNNQSIQKINLSNSFYPQDIIPLPKSQFQQQNEQSVNALQNNIGKPQFTQSLMNVNHLKIDQKQLSSQKQQHSIRSCSQGQQNFISNQYQTNDINTEAFALTKDFQEPNCFEKQFQNNHQYNTKNQNRWDIQKSSRVRQTSKDQIASDENKYTSTLSFNSNIQQNNQTGFNYKSLLNPTNFQSNNYETSLSEKKLVDRLLGKENKTKKQQSAQNQNNTINREGQSQQSKGLHKYQNSLSQQKQPQSLKKNLSQNEINCEKVQINPQTNSNSIFSQIYQQHQQNRQIIQQIMSSQNSQTSNSQSNTLNSHHNYSSSNNLPSSINQSTKHANQQIRHTHTENSYLNIENNHNKIISQNPLSK